MRIVRRHLGLAVFTFVLVGVLASSASPAAAIGETTWITIPETLSGFAQTVEQVTPETVFVGGTDGISRSINGGETWHKANILGESGTYNIHDIVFVPGSHREAWAVGLWTNDAHTMSQALILHTRDGGLWWVREDDEVGIFEPTLNAVDCDYAPDPVVMFAGDNGWYGFSYDQGSSWSNYPITGAPDLNDCSLNWDDPTSTLRGIVVGESGNIWRVRTVNEGSPSTTNETMGGTTEDLRGICENGPQSLSSAVVGIGEFHLEGTNNGDSWTRYTTIAPNILTLVETYYGIDFYAADEWYAAGRRYNTFTGKYNPLVQHTDDGGATWGATTFAESSNPLTDISILPKKSGTREGWACNTINLMHMASTTADRISGPTRYETAVEISEETLPGGLSKVAVLATGRNFADALSAAGLCGAYDAPLLLVRDDLGPVADELDRLNITDVFIVGGYGAVPQAVDDELDTVHHIDVTRLAGANRYETAAEVADEIYSAAPASTFFVARGDTFPDALAASPLAYSDSIPILLTRPTALPDVARQMIDERGGMVYIMGGTGAVSDGVQDEIDALLAVNTGNSSARLAGANRYETARAIAEKGVGGSWASEGFIGVATGQNFPDALAGGVAAGMMHGTLVLTPTGALHPAAEGFITDNAVADTDVRVFGGTGAVSEAVLDKIKTLY